MSKPFESFFGSPGERWEALLLKQKMDKAREKERQEREARARERQENARPTSNFYRFRVVYGAVSEVIFIAAQTRMEAFAELSKHFQTQEEGSPWCAPWRQYPVSVQLESIRWTNGKETIIDQN